MKKLLCLVLATFFLNFSAQADDIELGEAGYGGNGCPDGSASVTLSPDRKSLSILFDQYIVEAGIDRSMSRKSCNIAIPVRIPQGMSISLLSVDYRGFVSIPQGGYGKFRTEYFFAGTRGPTFQKVFRGDYDDEFLLSSDLLLNGTSWSPCGEDVNLRVNTSMFVKTNRNRDDAMASVDSADFSAGIVYHLKWRECY